MRAVILPLRCCDRLEPSPFEAGVYQLPVQRAAVRRDRDATRRRALLDKKRGTEGGRNLTRRIQNKNVEARVKDDVLHHPRHADGALAGPRTRCGQHGALVDPQLPAPVGRPVPVQAAAHGPPPHARPQGRTPACGVRAARVGKPWHVARWQGVERAGGGGHVLLEAVSAPAAPERARPARCLTRSRVRLRQTSTARAVAKLWQGRDRSIFPCPSS